MKALTIIGWVSVWIIAAFLVFGVMLPELLQHAH